MKSSIRLLFVLLLFLFLMPTAWAEAADAQEEPLVYSRYIDVPGVGPWYYYAQNDPEWGRSYYEPAGENHYRRFNNSGCGPTSLAIALTRQLDPEDFVALLDKRDPRTKGFLYCSCSINHIHCFERHEPTYVTTPEEFLHNLPRVLGAYAAGNNYDFHLYRNDFSGTSLNLFPKIAEIFGLDYVGTSKWEVAEEKLKEGYSVITTVTKGIFTTSSHYLVIANIDDEYIYLLDPWMRTEYQLDRKHRLEVLEPGLLRAKLEDFNRLGLYGFYMMKNLNRDGTTVSE